MLYYLAKFILASTYLTACELTTWISEVSQKVMVFWKTEGRAEKVPGLAPCQPCQEVLRAALSLNAGQLPILWEEAPAGLRVVRFLAAL